ncbi:hypothetical protein EPUL_004788 [Erysiphe pulchra]|uniref:RNase H type-1 domain-containing protein n=1 Tax=Erysiphe pulchra TaxID=225359 RepID=A0A2S4PUX1_9PEZI|nr:hypothetical protein EPUL_004788 [Erysiphe pulchra]
MGSNIIKPNDHKRWVGISLERKLNFKEHVRRACQRSRVVTDHVNRLCNTVRGTNPMLQRKAIQGTALATLFYSSETCQRNARFEIGTIGRDDRALDHSYWELALEHGLFDLTVYSDGSVNKDGLGGLAGAAYCIFCRPHSEFAHGLVPLGCTAEIHRALEGLRAALKHVMVKLATELKICLDNEEAALQLNTGVTTLISSGQIAEFQSLRKKWKNRARSRVSEAGKVTVRWVPSYSKIRRNERADLRADFLTKIACITQTTHTQASAARARRLMDER